MNNRSTKKTFGNNAIEENHMSFAPELDDLYSSLGKVIIQRRKKIEMTQTELAVKSGVDRSFISDLERGKRHPSFGTVNKIAIGLNMRYSRLVKQCEIYQQESRAGAANLNPEGQLNDELDDSDDKNDANESNEQKEISNVQSMTEKHDTHKEHGINPTDEDRKQDIA